MKNKFKGYVYKGIISSDINNTDRIIPVEMLDRHNGQVKIKYSYTVSEYGPEPDQTFHVEKWIDQSEYHEFYRSFEKLSDEIHRLKKRIIELEDKCSNCTS